MNNRNNAFHSTFDRMGESHEAAMQAFQFTHIVLVMVIIGFFLMMAYIAYKHNQKDDAAGGSEDNGGNTPQYAQPAPGMVQPTGQSLGKEPSEDSVVGAKLITTSAPTFTKEPASVPPASQPYTQASAVPMRNGMPEADLIAMHFDDDSSYAIPTHDM